MDLRALVAHADRTTLELIAAVLARDGFKITTARTSQDAEGLLSGAWSLCVFAQDLPGAGGIELARMAKEKISTARVVLVLDTALDAQARKDLMAATGCDTVLGRPFRYQSLKAEMVQWGLLEPAPPRPATDAAAVPPTVLHFELPPVKPPDISELAAVPVTAPTPSSGPASHAAPINLPPGTTAPSPLFAPAMPPAPAPQAATLLPLETAAASEAAAPAMELDLDDIAATPDGNQSAGAQLPTNVPAQGELATMPLSRLLFELYIATFTGIVRLSRKGVPRAIYLRGGFPVNVESNQLDESLGRILLTHGRITQAQLDLAQSHAESKSVRLGEALVETGAITNADLLDALKEQTELKLANTFSWREGTYRIEATSSFTDHMVLSEVHPVKSIWRGVSENYDLPSLTSYFAPLSSQYAVASELFAVHFDALGPFLRHLNMSNILNGKTTFGAALAQSDLGHARMIAHALYVLLVTDMLRPSATPGEAAQVPGLVESAATPGTAAPAATETLNRIADDIAREYLRIKESDYFEVLKVESTATADDVDAAYKNASRPWRMEDLPQGLPQEAVDRSREVNDVLLRARSVLRDPQLRERYVAAQRAKFTPLPVQTPAQAAPVQPSAVVELEVDTDIMNRKARNEGEKLFQSGARAMQSADYVKAEEKFRAALKHNEREPCYWVALARAILLQHGPQNESARQRAATALQQAFELDASHVGANLEMAKLLAAVGQQARAKTYVERVLQRSPENQEARQLLERI